MLRYLSCSCCLRWEHSVIAAVFKGFQLFQVLVSFSSTLSFPVTPVESFASQQQQILFISPILVSCSVIYRSPSNEKIALKPFIPTCLCFVKMKSKRSLELEKITAIQRGWGRGSVGMRCNSLGQQVAMQNRERERENYIKVLNSLCIQKLVVCTVRRGLKCFQ